MRRSRWAEHGIPGLIPKPGNVVLGQAAGLQRVPGGDAHLATADDPAPRRPDRASAMDGNGHDRHLVCDRDHEGAILELADGAIGRDPALRERQLTSGYYTVQPTSEAALIRFALKPLALRCDAS